MQSYQLAHALHASDDKAAHIVLNGNDESGNDQDQNCQICQFLFHHQQAQMVPMAFVLQQPVEKEIIALQYLYKSNTQIGFVEEFTNKGPPLISC